MLRVESGSAGDFDQVFCVDIFAVVCQHGNSADNRNRIKTIIQNFIL